MISALGDYIKILDESCIEGFLNCTIKIIDAVNWEVESCIVWFNAIGRTILELFFNGKVGDILNMSDCELLNILLRQLEREELEN